MARIPTAPSSASTTSAPDFVNARLISVRTVSSSSISRIFRSSTRGGVVPERGEGDSRRRNRQMMLCLVLRGGRGAGLAGELLFAGQRDQRHVAAGDHDERGAAGRLGVVQ